MRLRILAALLLGQFAAKAQNAQFTQPENTVVYVGLETPIAIQSDIALDKLLLETDNGRCQFKNGRWYWTAATSGQTSTLLVKNQGKELAQQRFLTKRIPDPQAALDKSNLKIARWLEPVLDAFIPCKCAIISYVVTLREPSGDAQVFLNQGGLFSKELQAAFGRLGENYTVTFSEIKAKCTGDVAARSLSDLTLRGGTMAQ